MADTLVRRFAARLHSLRVERGMTQELLASKAGISPKYISILEGAGQVPSLTTLGQLAKGLNTDLSVLLHFPETKASTSDRVAEELEMIRASLKGCSLDEVRKIRKAVEALTS